MKVDDNPFPGEQNMVDAGLLKGKTKILTSTKSKEAETVDPKMQISAVEYREIRRRRTKQKSRYEQGRRQSHVLHLGFCWISGSGRRKRIIGVG